MSLVKLQMALQLSLRLMHKLMHKLKHKLKCKVFWIAKHKAKSSLMKRRMQESRLKKQSLLRPMSKQLSPLKMDKQRVNLQSPL